MGVEKICGNAQCLASFTPNRRGATKEHCGRCVMYQRRHGGQLPGPKVERVPTNRHTVVLPADFEERLARVVSSDGVPLSTWVRLAAEEKLLELERRRFRA